PSQEYLKSIERILDPAPLLIPPVLTKTESVKEPVLQMVWSEAYEALGKAKHVVFIGYSLPVTDIAAGFLFREGLKLLDHSKQITVVDYAQTSGEQEERLKTLLPAYKNVFPKLQAEQFEFSGGRQWVFDNLPKWLHNSQGEPVAFIVGRSVFSRGG